MLLSLRPHSLTRLALAGFLIVVLPLLLIIGAASLYVGRLGVQAEELVSQSTQLARLDKDQTATIRTQSDQFVRISSEHLRATAREAQRALIIMVVTMIPLVVVLALYFTVQLTRPMQQINAAIRNLGRRAFSQSIAIDSPHELTVVGQQLEELRAQLMALEEEKNLFLKKMSHELKTPLASLREGSELLLDGTAGTLSATQMEIAGILRTNSLELQILIENLLDYEAWRDKSADLMISKFAFRPLVDTALRRHHLAIETKRLKVQMLFDDFDMQADRDRIRIMLHHLVSNAVKFAPVDGMIAIRASQDRQTDNPQRVTIEVADSGPGLLEEEHGKIFEAFFQGRIPPEGHLRGTGIGLSVVRDCVHAHGGNIELIEGEFPGAHFRIRFASPPAVA